MMLLIMSALRNIVILAALLFPGVTQLDTAIGDRVWMPALPAPHIGYPGAFVLEDKTTIYLNVSEEVGQCAPDNRHACALYALLGLQFYLSEDRFVGRAVTYSELLAIVYYGEFLYQDPVAAQALARGFFDVQSGACRWSHWYYTYDCSAENVLNWMAGMQHIIDAVVMSADGRFVLVDVRRLTGDRTGRETGYRYYQVWLDVMILTHLQWWRTGQGYSVPSTWGLVAVKPGGEIEGVVFARRMVRQDSDCAIYSIIVPVGNRHAVSQRCET